MATYRYERFFRQVFLRLVKAVFQLQVVDRFQGSVLLTSQADNTTAVFFEPHQSVLKTLNLIPQDFSETGELIGGFVWAMTKEGVIRENLRTFSWGMKQWKEVRNVFVIYPKIPTREEMKSFLREVRQGVTDVTERQYLEANLIAWSAHEIRHMLQAAEPQYRAFRRLEDMTLTDGFFQSPTCRLRYQDADFLAKKQKIIDAYRRAYQELPNAEFWYATEVDAYSLQLRVEDFWLVSHDPFVTKLLEVVRMIRQR